MNEKPAMLLPQFLVTEISRLAREDGSTLVIPIDAIKIPREFDACRVAKEHGEIDRKSTLPIDVIVCLDSDVSSANSLPFIFCLTGYVLLAASLLAGEKTVLCRSRIFPDQDQIAKKLIAVTQEQMPNILMIAEAVKVLAQISVPKSEQELILNRSSKTIMRLRKMSRWNEATKAMIADNPQKYPIRFLLATASRKLSNCEVEAIIRDFKPGLTSGQNQ